jgi:cytochrome c peroxidase
MNPTRKYTALGKRALVAFVAFALTGGAVLYAQEEMGPKLQRLPDPPKVDQKKAELGKLLFFDKRMAQDSNRSCAECHNPTLGFTTRLAISDGYPATKHYRNAPTVLNSAYLHKYFWHGSLGDLPTLVRWHNVAAFFQNADGRYREENTRQIPEYVKRFKEIYGKRFHLYGDILEVISEYVKTVVSDPQHVPFDRYLATGKGLTSSQIRGMELFNGKARCVQCHNGPLGTDQNFYNTAVPHNPVLDSDVEHKIAMRYEYLIIGLNQYVKNPTRDWGLYILTKDKADMGKFRTAPLRELKYTAPYMHNGVLETLEQVVDFYNDGGGNDPLLLPTKDPRIKPLGLSPSEKKDLVAFLEALSSETQPFNKWPDNVGEEKILFGVYPYFAKPWKYKPGEQNVTELPEPSKLTR